MKTLRLLLTLSLAGSAALFAADKQTSSSRVEVTFTEPEKFTDVKDSSFGSDKGRDATLEEFRDFITKRAEKLLPDGQKLSVNFTDIDLAGDYEPWRGPRGDDIRIVKDIYPPRLKFSYKITDAAGAVIKEEKKEISDLSFQMRLTIDRQDPLRYEKDLLSDWMKKDLRTKK
ncbi:MAG TPA: DUF3016 domain-containing protein [Opitutaceae bacterium]|nr:DUF3016 domain-containing protein [Opitutaceae bacterium]